jgi:hypothetical protein
LVSQSELVVALERARRRTEDLLQPLSDEQLTRQISPLQSPLVWDLAHIAHFEELWLLRRVGGRSAVSPEYDDLYDSFAHARGERGRLPILPAAVNRELDATFDQRRFVYEARWDPEHEWMEIGFRARRAHAVSIQRLEIDVVFDEDEPLRVEISSKFRREQFELETAQAGLRVESWWTDRAGDFAVALVLRDASFGS